MAMNNGGPAFPCEQHETQDNLWNQTFESGMTLRDYFATRSMSIAWDAYDKGYCGTEDASERSVDLIASFAYQIADAMIKARDEQEKQV